MVHKKSPAVKPLTLSIVIPVYNEENYLKACLESIASQTIKPLEVIIVDNNSTDNTIAIARAYSWVTLIHENKQGVTYARNKGFSQAQGDLIGRLDADTILPKDWIKVALETMTTNNFGAISGPVTYYDMPLAQVSFWMDHQIRLGVYTAAPLSPFLFGANMVIRTIIWQDLALAVCTARDIQEDIDLAIHVTEHNYKVGYVKLLRAAVSARRYDASFKDFLRYMSMTGRAYKNHNLPNLGPRLGSMFWVIGYVVCRPLRLTYNPATQKHSLKHALRVGKPPARKNPMS